MNLRYLILALLALDAFLGYKVWKKEPSVGTEEAVKVVSVYPVTRKNISKTASFIGTINVQQSALILAKYNGSFHQAVPAGAHLKKGQLIARVGDKNIEKTLALSQEEVKLAQNQYARESEIMKAGYSSKSAAETKKMDLVRAQKDLSFAKIDQEKTHLYAPFDGVVGVFKVSEGDQVQVGDALVNFYDPSAFRVNFDVPLTVAEGVKEGAYTFIKEQKLPLTHLQRLLDEDTHMCPAYVVMECPSCIAGSPVDVELIMEEKENAVVIPQKAFFFHEGKKALYQVERGKAILKYVEQGIENKDQVEVLSGVDEGDQVVTQGQSTLYPGMSVQAVVEPKTL